jgi:hypothetical protein
VGRYHEFNHSEALMVIDCPSMGFQTGGTVNISDAFESYGSPLPLLKLTASSCLDAQGRMRLERSVTKKGSMSFDMLVLELVPVEGCTLRIQ